MRQLIDSMAQPNDFIRVFCVDRDDPMERCARYEFKDSQGNGSVIRFHSGSLTAGVNGVTNEAVLQVLIDRLRPTPGRSSQKIEEALRYLRVALSLLREDFNEPWPKETGGTQ